MCQRVFRRDERRCHSTGQSGFQCSSIAASASARSGWPASAPGRRRLDSYCPTGLSSAVAALGAH